LDKIKTLREFDDYFTGPIHGFKNAIDYYEQSSSIRFVKDITIPTQIISALNDPFLSKDCFPIDLLANHPLHQRHPG
jgi:predicted alpha/beta-fold hydrolase